MKTEALLFTTTEVARLSKSSPRTVREYNRLGWFDGLRRGTRYGAAAVAVTELLNEVARLMESGVLTKAEARAASQKLRRSAIEAFMLAQNGRAHALLVDLSSGKTVAFSGAARAAAAVEQFTQWPRRTSINEVSWYARSRRTSKSK